jgi:3-deoxy-D-manno-octulosonic-acid transferase
VRQVNGDDKKDFESMGISAITKLAAIKYAVQVSDTTKLKSISKRVNKIGNIKLFKNFF